MEKKKAKTKTAPRIRPKADTRDVLGPPPRRAKINSKWQPHYRHLTELHDYFIRQKEILTRDANEEMPAYSEHIGDAGTDSYDRDFALSILSSDQNALYEIDEAIRRIETDGYGICELTGKVIPLKRLEAIPWTRFTAEAEKQLEQRGVVGRAHLGNLGSLSESESAGATVGDMESDEENT